MIDIKNLQKSYKNVQVLKGINFSIAKGDITSLYGASGSGKTTLLNIIGTLDTADQGYIKVSKLKRYFGNSNFRIANKGKQLVNFFIDILFTLSIYVLIVKLLNFIFYPYFDKLNGSLLVLYIVLNIISFFLSYLISYVIIEYKFRTTIGKLITKTCIITPDGLYPSRETILIRTVFIPFEPILLLFSKNGKGWHDRISNSIIIDKKSSIDYLNKLNSNEIQTEDELSSFRNQSIGFIFQFHNLLPEFTVIDNICLPGYFNGKPKEEVNKLGIELLSILGIADKANNLPNQLSGGEQQRVAVARALINNPDIVLADEPAGSLDPENSEKLHQIFISLRDRFETTFLIATHDKKLAEISDKVYKIKEGTILP